MAGGVTWTTPTLLAAKLGICRSTLSVWEARMPMLRPRRTSSGRRVYELDQVRVVERIAELRKEHMPLDEILQTIRAERRLARRAS